MVEDQTKLREHVGCLEARLAAADERSAGLEARLVEAERRLVLLDEAVFDAIVELGKPGAPLHGEQFTTLMRIFCKIDRCPECFHEDERRGDGPDATTPAEPRLRVVPEVQ